MAGAVGAIVAARRARESHRPVYFANVSPERLKATEDLLQELERKQKIRKIFERFDTNKSGKLEGNQVKNLLNELKKTETPPGVATDEEVEFILKVSDQSGDGGIDLPEMETALRAWKKWTKDRKAMEDLMKEFDKSNTGSLNKAELKQYLISLNGGRDVSDEEVDWVMTEADVLGDGEIHTVELVMATSKWFTLVQQEDTSKQGAAALQCELEGASGMASSALGPGSSSSMASEGSTANSIYGGKSAASVAAVAE
eukprot:CAMPEP_0170595788 /NCGR_PEP_ID=MMETSP0224-20130122/14752_1 /TAXON_ID=285029 /ORGANISM="Togula jolla, Strain CCCM 725" /LENGTH=255 /DNA_ID=CAMNT_0010919999 /DNA_START=72 /DNA_END=837 /DNA_ORIENTATION=+